MLCIHTHISVVFGGIRMGNVIHWSAGDLGWDVGIGQSHGFSLELLIRGLNVRMLAHHLNL